MNDFNLGLIVATLLSLPIIISILSQSILSKIVGLLFLLLFIIVIAISFEESKDNATIKKVRIKGRKK